MRKWLYLFSLISTNSDVFILRWSLFALSNFIKIGDDRSREILEDKELLQLIRKRLYPIDSCFARHPCLSVLVQCHSHGYNFNCFTVSNFFEIVALCNSDEFDTQAHAIYLGSQLAAERYSAMTHEEILDVFEKLVQFFRTFAYAVKIYAFNGIIDFLQSISQLFSLETFIFREFGLFEILASMFDQPDPAYQEKGLNLLLLIFLSAYKNGVQIFQKYLNRYKTTELSEVLEEVFDNNENQSDNILAILTQLKPLLKS